MSKDQRPPTKLEYQENRDLYIEAHRRAMYAGIAALLKMTLEEPDPIIGYIVAARTERGRKWVANFGGMNDDEHIVFAEMIRQRALNLMQARNPDMFAVEMTGYGDQVKLDDGKPRIVCGDNDQDYAGWEKRDNGRKLVTQLTRIARTTYNDALPQSISSLIEMIDEELQRAADDDPEPGGTPAQ